MIGKQRAFCGRLAAGHRAGGGVAVEDRSGRMRKIFWAALVAVGVVWFIAHQAGRIGVGYAAKQLCSGVFVSGLPEDFVLAQDVRPRLATVPLLSNFLTTELGADSASARVLTAYAEATHRPGYGCTLHGVADLAPAANGETSRAPGLAGDLPSTGQVTTDRRLEVISDKAFIEPEDGGRNTLAFLVLHRGQVVAERYAAPVTASTRLQGWSMNKSLMASFVGLQVTAGRMALSDTVATGLASRGVPPGQFAGLSDSMTLKHLMSMTSGLDFEERYFPGDDVTDMLYGDQPMWTVPAGQGQRHDPGTVFSYSSGDTNLVSFLWQTTLGGEPYPVWLDREVYRPLGLDTPILEPDVSGIQVGSSFAFLTARDWAQVGQWWLDAWHGRDDRLPREWQRLAVTPGVGAGGENYGLGFWLNTGQRMFPGLPDNTFHAGGNSGQFVVVIPDSELVVVRLGLTLDESKSALGPVLGELQTWAANSATGPG